MTTGKRKIIFVHGSLGMGGAEVLRMSILEEIRDRPDVDVRVCVVRQPGVLAERVSELGVPLDVLNNRGGLADFAGIWRLSRYLRYQRPEIAQSSQFLTNLQTRLAGWLAGIPSVIIEEHGIYSWKRWYHRWLDRLFNSGAAAVIACSNCVAESAAKNLGVDSSDVTVIHNCASQQHFQTTPFDRAAFRERVDPGSAWVVTVVGTLRWEKGHRYLMDAWHDLRKRGKLPAGARLWVVGSGPLEAQLRGHAQGHPDIVFLGSRNDTRSILEASDLFVLPSVNEGFGIAIVEAMCAGLPVISTRSGGIPEVIDDRRTGLLVEAGDCESIATAIESILSDRALAASMGKAAREEAEKRFTPKRYVDQLFELYESISRGGKPKRGQKEQEST